MTIETIKEQAELLGINVVSGSSFRKDNYTLEEVKEIEPTKKEETGPIVVDKTYNNRKEREYINKAPTIRKGQTFDVKIKQKARGFNKGGIKEGGKTPPITANSWQENNHLTKNNVLWRKLTPIECERLQTVPDNFSSCVSNSRRYSCLGNGWTVDVIVHLLKGMGL
jgi:site-specific DNA-cytosine methylase